MSRKTKCYYAWWDNTITPIKRHVCILPPGHGVHMPHTCKCGEIKIKKVVRHTDKAWELERRRYENEYREDN